MKSKNKKGPKWDRDLTKIIGDAPAEGGYMMRDDFAKKMNKKFSKQKQHRKKEMKK